jgi:pimeloyl-[acyl-carrier protein] methyl ester esterase
VLSRILLLPGLDGTGKLLDRFVGLMPASLSCEVIAYQDSFASLDDYVNVVKARLSTQTKIVLIAESFSGPIATHVASRYPEQVAGIVFAASFVNPPHPVLLNIASVTPAPAFGAMRATLVNYFCVDGVREKNVIDEASAVVGELESAVIKRRLMLLGSLTKLAHAQIDIPVLSLRATQDRLITKVATSSIATTFPKTISIDVEAPHFLLQACPEECWRHIEKFVSNYFV